MSARRADESFQEYRDRLKAEQLVAKQNVRGVVLWDSNTKGTYVKKRDGELGVK